VTRGADIVRVHDVAATRQALAVWRAVAGTRLP
jgi:dihydropteroate synthase